MSVSEQGQLYALDSNGVINIRTGRNDDNLSGDSWTPLADSNMKWKQFDAGNNEMFAVSLWNEVY